MIKQNAQNFADKWKSFAKRFDAAKCSRAEATRAIGMLYPRLVGFLNGYWDLNAEETAKLEEFLSSFEKVPNDE